MQLKKTVAAVLVLMLPALAWPAACVSNEAALRDECSAYSGAEMRECLERKVAASELAVNDAENKLKTALSRWDEDKKYTDIAKTRFAATSQEFIRNRRVQCAFAVALGGGAIGNALEIRRLACVAELNNQRARQVEAVATGLTER